MRGIYVDAEARQVYAAERAAEGLMVLPVADGRGVTALVRRVQEAVPELRGLTLKVEHARSWGLVSMGGFRWDRGKAPQQADLLQAQREGLITYAQARAEWQRRCEEYWRRPRARVYFVKIHQHMRNAWTVTHELAHVLQAARKTDEEILLVHGIGHGADFRQAYVDILEAWNPAMAALLRIVYREAGLGLATDLQTAKVG